MRSKTPRRQTKQRDVSRATFSRQTPRRASKIVGHARRLTDMPCTTRGQRTGKPAMLQRCGHPGTPLECGHAHRIRETPCTTLAGARGRGTYVLGDDLDAAHKVGSLPVVERERVGGADTQKRAAVDALCGRRRREESRKISQRTKSVPQANCRTTKRFWRLRPTQMLRATRTASLIGRIVKAIQCWSDHKNMAKAGVWA